MHNERISGEIPEFVISIRIKHRLGSDLPIGGKLPQRFIVETRNKIVIYRERTK